MRKILEDLIDRETKSIKSLVQLIDAIRPPKNQWHLASERFGELLSLLEENPRYREALSYYIEKSLKSRNFVRLFTELGINSNDSFMVQTRQKLIHRLLPEVHDTSYTYHLLDILFPFPTDHLWIEQIEEQSWSKFFKLLGMREIYQLDHNDTFLSEILNSVQVISIRINSLGLAQDIVDKLPELEKLESPFMAQNREVVHFIDQYLKEDFDKTTANKDYRHLILILDQCDEQIERIKKRKTIVGVSLKLTNYILRLNQNLKRIRLLLYLITTHSDNLPYKEEIHLLKNLINSHCHKKSLRNHFQDHLSLLAYQITNHSGQTGESYITTNAKEYWKMFRAAAGGGVIVAFLSVIKVLIYYLRLPPFGNAFLNSMNYSLGFIAIHVTKTKLATKQPAMTASRLAVSLDDLENGPEISLDALARMIKLIFRSQFIAFVGNVLFSLPIAFSLAWLYFWVTGAHLATPELADSLISNIHPWKSLSLFHAATAGVYLFLSGLISGYYDNLCQTERIPQRLRNHPLLRKFLTAKFLVKFSNYIEKNLGQLAGNFFLGIFLGSTATVGVILGLPLDIQHITFAAGNFGLSVAGLHNDISTELLVVSLFGIGAIGLMNFGFSFGLSTLVAIKSRNVNFRQTRELLKKVLILFIKNPLTFFIPPFSEKSIEYHPPSSLNQKK